MSWVRVPSPAFKGTRAKAMTIQPSYRQVVLKQLRVGVASPVENRLDTIRSFGVKSLALFGSVARDEASNTSDLDFLVEFEGTATFDRYMELKFFLEDLFAKPVDLVTKRSLKPQIAESVLREAINVA
jgi:predicted nucleotidyltransferase